MGSSPGSPRTLRGAIMSVAGTSSVPRIVAFQFNPDQVSRTLTPRTATEAGQVAPGDALRTRGAPVEMIAMTVEVDATDDLERGDSVAATVGVAPQLAALEMLLYPSTDQVLASAAMLLAGTIEILPPEAPLTVLAWGPTRVVPVRLTGLTVTEEAFDVTLNPIRATVQLTAQTLSYHDLQVTDAGYSLFLAHQVLKETLASSSLALSASAAVTAGR
ncbi:hypothetical protein [Actinomycetospora sp. NBRC 106375]|uniref:hypothetical protein n=1 Tax=Actinomycetospora sp. NBRC 106375 TaxID=3032207 RepID=UPI002555868A|nr:hypothetical protein [Actinomycetospora sp. NBRC 106375]